MKKGPTRAQLAAKVALLERKLARFKRGDTVRRVGEHWYELVEYFDEDQIQRLPTTGDTFLMGVLDEVVVVEVPATARPDEIATFQQLLKNRGMDSPCLVIRKGVRFLKLATVDAETEATLDAVDLEAHGEETEVPDAGTGPELSGDGLGSDRPGEQGSARSGSDPDEEGEGERAPVGG